MQQPPIPHDFCLEDNLDVSWRPHLGKEFKEPYMCALQDFLAAEISAGKTIFPRKEEILSALAATKFNQTKVVILGQDPYHGPEQAHGLSFSVKPGVSLPPSLLNIYKELRADLGVERRPGGHLLSWAQQGVLLLNSVLTVESGLAGSHRGKGWEQFTDRVIFLLAKERRRIIFVLWGAYAQKKCALIDRQRHCVLSSAHPSPLSAHRGFLGSRVFSKINADLTAHGSSAIKWG